MSQATLSWKAEQVTKAVAAEDFQQYQALSPLAVTSCALGLLSVVAFLHLYLAIVPILGVVLGFMALNAISARPRELTGSGLAKGGIFLSLLLGILGWGRMGYIYATEVPEGHQRISYAELQPDNSLRTPTPPASAGQLDGQPVFIKGYMYPGSRTHGLSEFVLVRDQGDCCFGGNPKISDRIVVKLVEPLRTDFTSGLVRVAGIFHVNQTNSAELGQAWYALEADHIQ